MKLKGLKKTVVRGDNILAEEKDDVNLLKILCEVFVVFKGNGLKLWVEVSIFEQ